MGEQWFLDLDGVRSGPYDDEEIVALLKEGELLPHHKISFSVDQPEWQTMIEWRLKKAFRDAAIQSSNTTTIPKIRPVEIRDQEAQRDPKPPLLRDEVTDVRERTLSEPLNEIEEEAHAMAHTFISKIPRSVVDQSLSPPESSPDKSRDAAVGQLLDLYQNIRGKRQETKQALPFANLQIEKTNIGTSTNAEGDFNLVVSSRYRSSALLVEIPRRVATFFRCFVIIIID
jgi:hypothetical protein